MSAECSEPPIDPARAAGSHSRYSAKSSSKIAGKGVGTQPGFERRRRVRLGADATDAELGAGLEQRVEDHVGVRPRPEELEAGLARHPVAQRLHVLAGDLDVADVEELDLGDRPVEDLLHDLVRVRPLQLVAVERRRALPHVRVGLEPVVHVLARGLGLLGVEAHPVDQEVVSDQHEPLAAFGVVEQDAVADQVAVLVDRDQLLGDAGAERREGVRRDALEHRDEVCAAEEELRHVVGLVHERDRGVPGALLVAPVRELRRDRERERRPVLVAQQLHRAAGAGDRLGEGFGCHHRPSIRGWLQATKGRRVGRGRIPFNGRRRRMPQPDAQAGPTAYGPNAAGAASDHDSETPAGNHAKIVDNLGADPYRPNHGDRRAVSPDPRPTNATQRSER